MAKLIDYIGRGWAFPFRFSSRGRVSKLAGVQQADMEELINMSLKQILGTQIGSRMLDRDFGSNFRGMIFVPIDQLAASRLRFAAMQAINTWEKRIEVLSIDVSIEKASEGIIELDITYRIISTQETGNLVYPLYLTPEMRVQGQINVG
jgi:phage baseplate assembly protein W